MIETGIGVGTDGTGVAEEEADGEVHAVEVGVIVTMNDAGPVGRGVQADEAKETDVDRVRVYYLPLFNLRR